MGRSAIRPLVCKRCLHTDRSMVLRSLCLKVVSANYISPSFGWSSSASSLMEIVFVGFLNERSYLFSDNLSKPSTMFVMSCFHSYLFWLHFRIYITQNLLMQRLKHFYLLLIGMRTLGSLFSKTCFRKKIVSIV